MRGVLRLGAVFAAVTAAAAAGDDKKAPAVKLEGTYTIVSGEKDGKPIPEERVKGSVVTFKGDRVVGTDKDKKELFAATFELDTSAKPYKISMTETAPRKGEKAAGIIEVDGDTVKLCYAGAGGQPPTEFKTKENQHLFVLKRQTK